MARHKTAFPKLLNAKNIFFFAKVIFFVLLFYLFMNYKALLIVVVFEVLDFFKNIMKQIFPFIPIDLVFIFGVAAAYYYGFIFAVVIFVLGVINRAVMACLELRHLSKAIRHLPLFFLVSLFIGFPFFAVAMIALSVNYVLKFFMGMAGFQAQFHIVNFLFATSIFYILSIIYYYMPFLA